MEYKVSAHLTPELLTWGRVTAKPEEPLVAGATSTLEMQVTLSKALESGVSIEAWIHFVSDTDFLQCQDSAAANFFSCRAPGTEVSPFVMRGGVHGPGCFFPYRRVAGVRLPAGAPANTQLHFRMARLNLQTYEETLFNVRFAIMRGDEPIGYLGDAFYSVVGAEPSCLRVIAPTCAERGQAFEASIVTCDRFGNKTAHDIANLQFELQLEHAGGSRQLPAAQVSFDPARRFHTLRCPAMHADGVYYLRARVAGNPGIAGRSNPMVVRQAWPQKVYWGDLHQHTYLSDGRGTPAANYEYARSTSRLDFCAVTPHEEYTFGKPLLHLSDPQIQPQKGWEELVAATEAYNGRDIVTILGSEAGSLNPVAGHMNSYYLDANNRPELERLRAPREGVYQDFKIPSYLAYLEEIERSRGEFLLLPHAHAGGGPGKYDLPLRPQYQTSIEIASVHGVFEEFYRQWLEHGHTVGVNGGGDNHMTSTGNANPGRHYPNTNGLTGAYAPQRDRQGIWDAFRQRRTYAVTGNQRIFLEFSSNAGAMGSVLPRTSGDRRFHLSLAGTAPILKVELFKNNRVLHSFRPPLKDRRHLRLVWTDDFCSRRPENSLTTGAIRLAPAGASLELLQAINAYNRSDSFRQQGQTIEFRAGGYSGITRGVIARVDGPAAPAQVLLQVHDEFLGRTLLEQTFTFDAQAPSGRQSMPLDVEPSRLRPLFTKQPHHAQFQADFDWIDLAWPAVVELDWSDMADTADFYYVRAEQIDGNIAWSSPVWYR